MAGAADLEVDQALVLELDFLVVDAPRQQHRPVDPDEVVAGEAVGGLTAVGRRGDAAARRAVVGQRTALHQRSIHRRRQSGARATARLYSSELLHDPPRQSLPVGRAAARKNHRNGRPEGRSPAAPSTLTQAYFKKGAVVPLHAHPTEHDRLRAPGRAPAPGRRRGRHRA